MPAPPFSFSGQFSVVLSRIERGKRERLKEMMERKENASCPSFSLLIGAASQGACDMHGYKDG